MAFGLCKLPNLEVLGSHTGPLIPAEDRYKAQSLDVGGGWDVGSTGSFYYVDLGCDTDAQDEQVRLLRTRSIPAFEDPGTGSASAALCCYIALTEGRKGQVMFHLVQGVEMGRRCDISVDLQMKEDGSGVENVELSGTAVEVMEGSLTID